MRLDASFLSGSFLDLRFLAAPAAIVAVCASAHAQQALRVGSFAPDLPVEAWAQGEVTSLGDPEKTYVVEFWATWCGPCMRSIPHLNELYKRNKGAGLVIIGISDEPMSTVKPFVQKKGGGMTYPVGIDNRDKDIKRLWMEAANLQGIPSAFVVRNNKILWIGNPLDDAFDHVVVSVVRGRYDPELERKAAPILKAANDAIAVKNFRDAYKHYDAVLGIDQRVFGEIASKKYESMLADAKDVAGARAWGETVLSKWAEDRYALLDLAQTVLMSDRIKVRDFELASRATEALLKVVPSGDPQALNLQARVKFAQGSFEEAQEFQYQAWMAASPDDKSDFRKLLDEYRKAAKTKSAKVSGAPASGAGDSGGEQKEPANPTP